MYILFDKLILHLKDNCLNYDYVFSLTHFSPMFHFYTPWRRQKNKGMKIEHWSKIGKWNEVEYKSVVLFLIDSKTLYMPNTVC